MTVPQNDPYWDKIAEKFPPPPGVTTIAADMGVHPAELNARLLVIQKLALEDLAREASPLALITKSELKDYLAFQRQLLAVLKAMATLNESRNRAKLRAALGCATDYLAQHDSSRVPAQCGHSKSAPGCFCHQNWLYNDWIGQARAFLRS